MPDPFSAFAAVSLSYLLGAVPFALLLGGAAGVDLRSVGSRNVGAGNLTRTVGLRYGAAAAILDGLKGLAPVLVARRFGLADGVVAASGIAAVIGHNWSVYLRSRSGRGLATAVGVLTGLAPSLLIWTGLWAVAGWWIGGGIAGFIGWGLLVPAAVFTGQTGAVVAATVVLSAVVIGRRMQGNIGAPAALTARMYRAVWDTDRPGSNYDDRSPQSRAVS